MLKKIISLQGIGRFERFACSGDVEFKKYTLIYAENGVGKTTLCDIIRSLQMGDPAYIMGRRTIGSVLQPEAKILLSDGRLAHFKNGQWSVMLDGVTIFDATYVRDNVHAGEVVDISHRRNLFQVVVGAEGVKLARTVEDLETKKTELNGPIRTSKQTLDTAIPDGMTLAQFLALHQDPDVDQHIESAERALTSARKYEELRRHRGFTTVTIPEIPSGMIEVLGLTLDNVSEQAERLLQDHVGHLGADDGQRWLSRGLALMRDDTCPFCARGVDANELVAAYRACFSASFRDLAERAASLQRSIDDHLNDSVLARIETAMARNSEANAFWVEYCHVPPLPVIDMEQVKTAVTQARLAALNLAERKAGNLLEPVTEDSFFQANRADLNESATALRAYNVAAEVANATINAHRAALESLDMNIAKASLAKLQAQKARFSDPVRTACETYQALQSQRAEFEARKTEARFELERYMARVIVEYEGVLNRHLERFAVGFRIRGTRAEFPKGLPSSTYQIVINGVPIDLGSEKTGHDEPSFRNTLSGGDRSALALSLFMAELERADTPPEIAIVLDDPFQSQDSFRRTATAFRIKEIGTRCGQVIVLSHDPQFLKLVWDNLPVDKRKAMQLHSAASTTALTEWDIQEAVKESHLRNVEALQRYLEGDDSNAEDVAKKVRPTLEGHCRAVCPGQFGNKALGEIIEQIRAEGETHPLHGLLEELDEINMYARQFHHAPGEVAPDVILTVGELKNYCQRTLKATRTRLT